MHGAFQGWPIPPFSRGLNPQSLVFVACGQKAWDWSERARERDDLLVLPPDGKPECFDWSQLANCDVVSLVHNQALTETRADGIARAILRDGAQRVVSLVRAPAIEEGRELVSWTRAP